MRIDQDNGGQVAEAASQGVTKRARGQRSPAGLVRGPEYRGSRPELALRALTCESMGQSGRGWSEEKTSRSTDRSRKSAIGSALGGRQSSAHNLIENEDIFR